MKQHSPKTHAGVWLDNAKAIIINNHTGNEQDDYAVAEQVKSKGSFGGGSEHSMNNAKQSDMLKYFKSLSGLLTEYDEILIFGPGKSQEQFQHHLQQDAQFNNKRITIESADHLTNPQMIARVRDFFRTSQS